MKIHSDILTVDHMQTAAKAARVSVVWPMFKPGGSQSRKNSFVVHLSGSSRYRAGFAGNNGLQAATWDEWGMFLAALFERSTL